MTAADAHQRINLVAADLSHAVIGTDFDGTLSLIVDDPSSAIPVPGAYEALDHLAAIAGEVAVISGRPISFLEGKVPPSVTVVGLYGLESLRHGEHTFQGNSGVWRETMADVATAAELQGPAGMLVESKGLSITLHYRGHPQLAEEVAAYSERAAESAGLRRRKAKMSYELHPPIDEDKGTVISRFASAHSGPAVYIGDDIGDLAAFDALDRLEAEGRTVLRVAVDSNEADEELRVRADVVLDGPESVLTFLSALVPS